MSVAEHLYFYGRLKNIKNLDSEVNRLIHDLDLEQYKGKLSQNLSGGNKRKLSTAISLIGRPSIVLLDEPSAGMDPQARRFMWQVIKQAANKNSAVILSTHSMEEAEALSTKMGIMTKGGQFRCFGTS
jgi:ABC-type multidrug transport system ATPase subunit